MNVQHLETVAYLVERATGIRVRATVPDWVVVEADEVVLVDLPPEDLRARLAEGKVYPPEKVAEALRGFFTLENLKALRELALAEVSGLAAGRPAPLGPVLVYGDVERVFLRAARVAERFGEPLYLLTETVPEGLLRLAHAHRPRSRSSAPCAHPSASWPSKPTPAASPRAWWSYPWALWRRRPPAASPRPSSSFPRRGFHLGLRQSG